MNAKTESSPARDRSPGSVFVRCLLAIVLVLSSLSAISCSPKKAEAAATGKVTYYQKVTQGLSTVGYYEIDGKIAFCAEHSQTSPGKGATYTMVSSNVQNADIRKVLYYGYSGPGDLGYSRLATTLALSIANGDTGGKAGQALVDAVKGKANPGDNFRVVRWVAQNGNYQDLMTWVYTPEPSAPATPQGYVQLHKSSADPDVTDGNSDYSLAGAVYYVYHDNGDGSGALATTLTTDANGNTSVSKALEYGNYKYVERVAPKGYSLDTTVRYFTLSGSTVDSSKTVHLNVEDTPITAAPAPEVETFSLSIVKEDSDTASKSQGGASLEGALFEVSYALDGVQVALSLETDATGKATLPSPLPAGTQVTVREIEAPEGYVLSDVALTHTVTEGDNVAVFPNEVARGGLGVVKLDSEMGTAQGDGTLAGITFEIVSENDNPVVVRGETYQKGQVVATLTTDAEGIAETEADALPYGTYTITEVGTNSSYLNTSDSVTAFVDEDGIVYSFEMFDDVVRGGVSIAKVDRETLLNAPLGGATVDGAVYEIRNISDNHVMVDGKRYGNGAVVKTITTVDGVASTSTDALPYGTYTIREVAAPEGYLLNDKDVRTFEIREDGLTVVLDDFEAISDQVKRGDVELLKVEEDTMQRMGNAPFKITSKTTGESHVIVTDENGYASTASSWNPHSQQTNRGETSEDGVWFGLAVDGSMAPVNDELGALPYDSYIVEELPCEANEHHQLVTFEFTVSHDTHTIDLGTVTNRIIPTMEISKVDATTSEELPGATLRLEHDGELVEEWISTSEPHVVKGLEPGVYTLTEVIAPEGYVLSTETVTIDTTGTDKIVAVEMENDYTKIDIFKKDMASGNELPGAELSVIDEDGNVVESWISTEAPHRIEKLAPGSYVLREVIAPAEYLVANEVEFTVEATGEVQTVEMLDELIEIKGQIDKRETIIEKDGEDVGTFEYTIDYRSVSNAWVDEFNMTDPLDCVNAGLAYLESLSTPVSQGDYDGLMNVWYQTNMTSADYMEDAVSFDASASNPENPHNPESARVADFTGWKLWKEGVSAATKMRLDVDDLGLAEGEYVTAIRFEHGRVEDGFSTRVDGWDRDGLKAEDDVIGEGEGSSQGYSSAVLYMRVTDAYGDGSQVVNSANIDLHRNLVLHDDDADKVVQVNEEQPEGETFDKTGDGPVVVGVLIAAIGVAITSAVLLLRRLKD